MRDLAGESGYACVYPAGRNTWRVRLCRGVNLRFEGDPPSSCFYSREEAAWYAASWLKWWYGERWQEAFRSRKNNPWKVRLGPNSYSVDVYLRGTALRVGKVATGPGIPPLVFRRLPASGVRVAPTPGLPLHEDYFWPTKEDAVRAAQQFMRHCLYHMLGVFSPCLPPPTCLLFWRPLRPQTRSYDRPARVTAA